MRSKKVPLVDGVDQLFDILTARGVDQSKEAPRVDVGDLFTQLVQFVKHLVDRTRLSLHRLALNQGKSEYPKLLC